MKEIITITGEIGSGKSTVGRILAASLGYEHISTGMMQRKVAAQRGLTSLELNELSMGDRGLDDAIDSYVRKLNDQGSRLVLDSRLAWHFIQHAFNVFVYVDPVVGARRVLANKRAQEVHADVADAVRNNLRRKHLEDERFARLYGVHCDAPENYHLLIDSTWATPETVAAKIAQGVRQGDGFTHRAYALLAPKSLFPTQSIRYAAAQQSDEISASIKSHGFDPREPVEVVRFSEYHFIVDGHRRVSCALRAGLDYVPCVIRRSDEKTMTARMTFREEIAASLERPWISDWEDAHDFRFPSRPDAAGNPRFE